MEVFHVETRVAKLLWFCCTVLQSLFSVRSPFIQASRSLIFFYILVYCLIYGDTKLLSKFPQKVSKTSKYPRNFDKISFENEVLHFLVKIQQISLSPLFDTTCGSIREYKRSSDDDILQLVKIKDKGSAFDARLSLSSQIGDDVISPCKIFSGC